MQNNSSSESIDKIKISLKEMENEKGISAKKAFQKLRKKITKK